MNRHDRGALGALTALAIVLAPGLAAAEVTKDQCVDANTQAQAFRRGQKFKVARERLRVCIDAACPGIVRDDCARRLDELEGAQPTIVFEAKDAAGGDVTAVSVTVDGQPLADSLTGAALAVDPGEHTFAFQVAGQAPVTRRLVLHESEKSRRERVVVVGAAVASTDTPSSSTPESTPVANASTGRDRRLPGFIIGGAGVVGILVGSVFGLVAIAKDADASCQENHVCSNSGSERSAISAANLSTVAFAAGGVLLAGGIVWVVLAPRSHATTPAALELAPTLGTASGGVTLRGSW